MVQRNLRKAAVSEAETEAVRVVKGAQANAEELELRGKGMALKREAIAQGLVNCVVGDYDTLSFAREFPSAALAELLLATEYLDTLREIGARDTADVVFLHQ